MCSTPMRQDTAGTNAPLESSLVPASRAGRGMREPTIFIEEEPFSMNENRRRKTRVRFETQVILRTKDVEVTAEASSRDISLQGVFLATDAALPQGAPCEVEILLTGSSSRLSIRVRGHVARRDAGGLGIVFESIDPDSYFHLRNLLLYNSSDPEEIENEQALV